jgi:predicted transcriptional regulator
MTEFTSLAAATRASSLDVIPPGSKLETFIKSRDIRPAHLARESGYTRQHLHRIRTGRMEPTRRCIKAIVTACRHLSHEAVGAADLFELEA